MPFLLKMSDRRLAAAILRASPPKLPPLAAAKFFALFSLAALATGCAARQAVKPPTPPTPGQAAAVAPAPRIQPVSLTPAPSVRSLPTTPSDIPPAPTPRSPHSAQVAEKLDSAFRVESIGPDFLLASKKTTTPARTPSLFEQSILLGKIRSALPRPAPASLKNGVATVSIPSQTPPGTAAVAIAKILALDGVNSVRAEFPSTPQ
jgi:hypothetical protein